jgi:hypothetical protein
MQPGERKTRPPAASAVPGFLFPVPG